jgi:nitrite reductase (NADH) small subunit
MSQWSRICAVTDIPALGARVVRVAEVSIAVFRTAEDRIFALRDRCPHKGGPLSQGIVHGEQVTCPLHGWVIGLEDGAAEAPDVGCTGRYEVRVEDGQVWLNLAPRAPLAAAREFRPAAS